ncbi:hypothetical protein RIF29_40182 [Crotalaria pallida]|uniref:Uncharacterized protein n=1 Tax=Crotalaria pallida TaxID=3830 RepID=A0AAN9HRF6_CROPI
MHPPPSRHVSWANPVATNTNDSSGSIKHNKRAVNNNQIKRLTKLPPPTTTAMPKKSLSTKLGEQKSSASKKPSKLLAYPASNSKCSKPKMSKHNKCLEGKNHHLLAGYLAHEYLTKRTLMGRRWDQLPSQRVEPKQEEKVLKYMEIAHLLKTDGSEMDGIVNPTQLAYSLKLL